MTKTLSAELPADLIDRIDALAADAGTSQEVIVERLLEVHFGPRTEKERDRLTREAIAQADAGQLVSHEAVVAWVDSLGTDRPLARPRP